MRLYGLETDAQETGDLLVGVTLSDELNDAKFPVCQSRSLLCGTSKEGIQERLRDFGSEEWIVSRKGLDRADQMAPSVGLEEVTACADPKQLLYEGFVVIHRED